MNGAEPDPKVGGERLRLTPDSALWRRVGDEVVVYDVERSEYLATNPAATVLWPLLAEGATLPELAGALRERWGIGEEQARADVRAFLEALRSQGLMEA